VERGSSSFLKKRTKKLLRIWARSLAPALSGKVEAKIIKSFLLLFFKKEGLASGRRIHPITLLHVRQDKSRFRLYNQPISATARLLFDDHAIKAGSI
jgi:hypothetical protein